MHRTTVPVADLTPFQHREGMPKKKRHRRTAQQAPRSARERSRTERREAVVAYQQWRSSAAPEADAAGETEVLEILLEFTAEELDSPDPGLWPPQTILRLFHELLHHRSLVTQGHIAFIQEAVLAYFAFLGETKRWHTCAGSIDAAALLVGSFSVPAAEADRADRGLPAPGAASGGGEHGGGRGGEDFADGLLDPAMACELLERVAEEIADLHLDLDGLSFGGSDDWRESAGEGGGASLDIVLATLDRLDGVREVLDQLASDVYLTAALR